MPCDEFIEVVKFVLDSTFFGFNNIIYQQTFGYPMGSHLSPLIADLVLQDLERNSLNSLKFVPPVQKRYVDDILIIAPRDQVEEVLNTFNSYHSRLQFTVEFSTDNRLNFLDVTLLVNNEYIKTDWFHKKLFQADILTIFPTILYATKRVLLVACLIEHSFYPNLNSIRKI